MSKRNYILFLNDKLKSSEKILRYADDKSFEEFVGDEMLTDAVIRNLEVIGEAVKNLPAGVKQKFGDIEWKKIAGLRNTLIHEYFGIDYEVLWGIVKNKVPQLKEQVEVIFDRPKEKR